VYVDSRVAHGRARHDLGKNPRMFHEFLHNQVRSEIQSFVFEHKLHLLPRREVMRLMKRRLAPKLNRFGLDARMSSGENFSGLQVTFVTRSPDLGIQHRVISLPVDKPQFTDGTIVQITPHALARCMQRNAVMSLEAIERQTWLAVHFADAITRVAGIEGWKQIGVPVDDGLFVGRYDDDEGPVLRTYFQPLANGRRSRWAPYLEAIGPISPMSAADARGGSVPYSWIIGRIKALDVVRPMRERFPFLLEPYEHTDDPLETRWLAAHQGQVKEPHSSVPPGATHA
jgi:hypothetical protein